MTIQLRQMQISDLPRVYELGLLCFNTWEVPYQAWTVCEIAHHFQVERDHCFVATDNNKVVGFSLGAENYDVMTDTGQIEWTAVHPDYHGQSLGGRLFQTNCDSLAKKGKYYIVTDVTESNESVRRMVERAGFRVVATVNFWM